MNEIFEQRMQSEERKKRAIAREIRKEVLRQVFLWISLLGFVAAYFFFATLLIHQTNQNRQRSDQQNNIDLARFALAQREKAENAAFPDSFLLQTPHYTDGVVNPLWPWVTSFLIDPGEDDAEVFFEGKWAAVWIAVIGLLAIALRMSKFFTLPGVLTFLVIAGFGAFLKQSSYFQPETIYYLLFFCAWVLALKLFHKQSYSGHFLLGLVCGLAYLAKGSIQFLLLGFLTLTVLRSVMNFFLKERATLQWSFGPRILGILLLSLGFFTTAFPRFWYADAQFGNATHSWPQYWMWVDSFEDGAALMAETDTREEMRALRKTGPSLANYFKNHKPSEAVNRLWNGVERVGGDFLQPAAVMVKPGKKPKPWKTVYPDRAWYLGCLIALSAVVGGFFAFGKTRRTGIADGPTLHYGERPAWLTASLFVIGVSGAYLLAIGWYAPIGKGDRFLLALYAPLAFSFLWPADAGARWLRGHTRWTWVYWVYAAGAFALIAWAVTRLVLIARYPEFFSKW